MASDTCPECGFEPKKDTNARGHTFYDTTEAKRLCKYVNADGSITDCPYLKSIEGQTTAGR